MLCGLDRLSIDGKLNLKEMQELPVVQTLMFSMPDLKDYSINVARGGHDKPQIRVDLSHRLVWIVIKEDQSKKLSKAIYKAEKRLRKAIKAARDVDLSLMDSTLISGAVVNKKNFDTAKKALKTARQLYHVYHILTNVLMTIDAIHNKKKEGNQLDGSDMDKIFKALAPLYGLIPKSKLPK